MSNLAVFLIAFSVPVVITLIYILIDWIYCTITGNWG